MQSLDIPFELRFLIALALAFLIGLERESSSARKSGMVFAGVRTYTLIGVYGFGCAYLYHINIPWALPAGMLSLAALVLIGYMAKLKVNHVGWTSEVAALLTFIVGVLSLLSEIWVPLTVGIVGTFLLSEKSKIEKFVERVDKAEFLAVLKFLVVTLIILPALPNQEFTQFNLNPRKIWQIVVLVSSIGFAGYLLTKKFGSRIGLWLSGITGGIVSSTAVAIAAGRIAQSTPEKSNSALQATILGSSVMYLRILVLVAVISPHLVPLLWWRMAVLAIAGGILAAVVMKKDKAEKFANVAPLRNPFEIKPALIFATLFVIMTIITVMIKNYYGNPGLLSLAAITGVTDIDPFILSLINQSSLVNSPIIAAILISMLSNTIAKGIYFGSLARSSRRTAFVVFIIWSLLHIPLMFNW